MAVDTFGQHILVDLQLLLQAHLLEKEPYERIEPAEGQQYLQEAKHRKVTVAHMVQLVSQHIAAHRLCERSGQEYAIPIREGLSVVVSLVDADVAFHPFPPFVTMAQRPQICQLQQQIEQQGRHTCNI